MIDRVRVLVIGEDEVGRSELRSTREVPAVAVGPTQRWWYAWGADDLTDLSASVDDYRVRSHFPNRGGVRVMVARFPAGEMFLDEQAVTETEQAGSARVRDLIDAELAGFSALEDHPAMHRTATFDLAFVAEGELELHTSDQTIVRLGPGDLYINDGALHAWRSSQRGATVIFTIFGRSETDA